MRVDTLGIHHLVVELESSDGQQRVLMARAVTIFIHQAHDPTKWLHHVRPCSALHNLTSIAPFSAHCTDGDRGGTGVMGKAHDSSVHIGVAVVPPWEQAQEGQDVETRETSSELSFAYSSPAWLVAACMCCMCCMCCSASVYLLRHTRMSIGCCETLCPLVLGLSSSIVV